MIGVFDHHDQPTPVGEWDEALTALGAVSLPQLAALIVVAAHPDDETLGAGGVIAMSAHRGLDIEVVVASDGEASHPRSSTHPPAALAALRRVEARAAVRALANDASVSFLGLPDGQLAEHVAGIEDALRARVQRFTGPVWVLAPWAGDNHPDHAACALAARRVSLGDARLGNWEYPIWLWHWGHPVAQAAVLASMRRFELDARAAAARQDALGCYASQTRALSDSVGDEAVLSADFLRHFQRDFDVLIDPSLDPASGATDAAALSSSTLPAASRAAHSTTDEAHFRRLYANADDPWQLETRWYEQRKRHLLLASLPRPRFARAFEPGCATGSLTAALAARCDALVAVDITDRAVAQTHARLAGAPGVEVARMKIADDWPGGSFDLIVLSEVGYYLDLAVLCRRVLDTLRPDGVVVLCHWRHRAPDHPHTAEHTHHTVRSLTGLHVLASHVEEDFLLDVLTVQSRSVAVADPIVAQGSVNENPGAKSRVAEC